MITKITSLPYCRKSEGRRRTYIPHYERGASVSTISGERHRLEARLIARENNLPMAAIVGARLVDLRPDLIEIVQVWVRAEESRISHQKKK
jgi:hypothetical protein